MTNQIDDRFQGNDASSTSPPRHFEAVVPSDTVDFSQICRNIYIGGAGNVAFVREDGTVVTYVGLAAGSNKVIRARRINATGTTATNMVWEA